jgi:hypothetical protein
VTLLSFLVLLLHLLLPLPHAAMALLLTKCLYRDRKDDPVGDDALVGIAGDVEMASDKVNETKRESDPPRPGRAGRWRNPVSGCGQLPWSCNKSCPPVAHHLSHPLPANRFLMS